MNLSREFKTGVIVLTGILAVIIGLSYLKSNSIFESNRTFYAVYDQVNGLQAGTPVTINGLNVGTVNSIRFLDNSGKLLVTFSVSNSFEFSANSPVELYDTGIIGGKGMQIIPIFDSGVGAKSGDTLVTGVKPGLTELLQQKLAPLQNTVEGTFMNADSLLVNLNSILDTDTKSEFRQTVANLNVLLKSFKGSADKINTLLGENQEQLDNSLKNLNTITSNFSTLSTTLTNAGLDNTIKEFQQTLNGLNGVLAKLEKGEGTLGKFAKDDEIYDNLADVTRELDLLLQDFRLNPKRYVNVSVFGKKQKTYEVPEDDPAAKLKN